MAKKKKQKKMYVAFTGPDDDMAVTGSLKDCTEKAEYWYYNDDREYDVFIGEVVPVKVLRANAEKAPWEDLS